MEVTVNQLYLQAETGSSMAGHRIRQSQVPDLFMMFSFSSFLFKLNRGWADESMPDPSLTVKCVPRLFRAAQILICCE